MSTNFIHPSSLIEDSVSVGDRTKIWHGAQIRRSTIIGKDCIIGKGVYIDSGIVIGDRVKIQNYACVYRECTIEDEVFIGPHVIITNDKYPRAATTIHELKGNEDWHAYKTLIRKGASLGAGSIVLPGITIGAYSLIGAGSVVTKEVAAHCVVIGNPAQNIGFICCCGKKISRQKPHVMPYTCSLCKQNI